MKILWTLILLASTQASSALEEYQKTISHAKSVAQIKEGFILGLKDKTSLANFLKKLIKESDITDTRNKRKAQVYYDCLSLLNGKLDKADNFLTWLVNSPHLSKFLYTINSQDNKAEVYKIMKTLYEEDPRQASKYFNLMVAFAVVWDQKRKKMHHQMGPKTLSSTSTVTELYNYYRKLYSRGAKMNYSRLTIQDLIFVVNVPVPLSELDWARKNVKSSLSSWGKLYPSITYNHPRLKASQYSWVDGDYSLSEIKKHGGICVDQSYYTIMTARAFGIPALYFQGRGRNAGEMHAWAGYMVSTNKWNLEVGRYSSMKFTTGFANDPQSNSRMTDHMLDFKCNKALKTLRTFTSRRLVQLSQFYTHEKMTKYALICAQAALTEQKYNLDAWKILEEYYAKHDANKLISLLKSKMSQFKKYPDFVYQIGMKAIKVMEENGKTTAANSMRKELEKRIKSRDDLNELNTTQKVADLYKNGKADEARKIFEKYLKKQPTSYDALESDLKKYLKYTKSHEQTSKAVSFLRILLRGSRLKKYKSYLKQAYINNGDQRRADRL